MSFFGVFTFGRGHRAPAGSNPLASGSAVWSGSIASGASGAIPPFYLASGMISLDRQREKEIRASVPLCDETPAQIVANWLQDNLRDDDAAFMRTRMSGG